MLHRGPGCFISHHLALVAQALGPPALPSKRALPCTASSQKHPALQVLPLKSYHRPVFGDEPYSSVTSNTPTFLNPTQKSLFQLHPPVLIDCWGVPEAAWLPRLGSKGSCRGRPRGFSPPRCRGRWSRPVGSRVQRTTHRGRGWEFPPERRPRIQQRPATSAWFLRRWLLLNPAEGM